VATLALLAVPIGVAAQPADSTITVPGLGSASAPADSATIQLVVGKPAYGPPQPLPPGAVPGEQERRAVPSVVEALVAEGVSESDIVVIVGPYVSDTVSIGGPATAVIRFTVTAPTSEAITGLVDAASMGASEERRVVGRVTVPYHVDVCAAFGREACEHAVAGVQPEVVGVDRGGIVSSRDTSYCFNSAVTIIGPPVAQGGCAPVDTDTFLCSSCSGVMSNPTFEPEVEIRVQVELTFEMTPSSGATPAA